MPLAPSEFSDRANVAISLLERGRRLPAELGVTPRWNEYPHRSSFTSLMGGFVDGLGVVRTVGGYRRDGVDNLLKQCRDLSAVMRPASGQIRRDDLTRLSIDSEVQFPPSPVSRRFLHMTDVDPESCTVDEYVNRLTRLEPANTDLTKFLQSPRQRGVIRDWEIDLEPIC